MRAIPMTAVLASVCLLGCLSGQYTPPPDPGPGNPTPQSPVQDPGNNQSDAGAQSPADLASAPAATDDLAGAPASGDLAGSTAAGKPFGANCTVDGDCASGMCRGFVMQTVLRCTQPCTIATQATDCPAPPSAGQCTNMGYCKFSQ